jgi:hypothetical protein
MCLDWLPPRELHTPQTGAVNASGYGKFTKPACFAMFRRAVGLAFCHGSALQK